MKKIIGHNKEKIRCSFRHSKVLKTLGGLHMKRGSHYLTIITFLLFICLLPILQAQGETKYSTYILLKNALIIDGISETAKKGDVLIRDQQIENIDYKHAIKPPKNTIIYDLTDKFIIPGLIDAHVHFGTDPIKTH